MAEDVEWNMGEKLMRAGAVPFNLERNGAPAWKLGNVYVVQFKPFPNTPLGHDAAARDITRYAMFVWSLKLGGVSLC